MLFTCPIHDHEYSKQIIKESFGNKYDTNKIHKDSLIGSGTIAQVYKLEENVIKYYIHKLNKKYFMPNQII